MSRLSQTFPLIGNLNSSTVRSGTAPKDDNVETITEQFLPRRQRAVFGDQFIFQTATLQRRVKAKLVLLAPLPCDAPPFAKSEMYLSSLLAPISAAVHRHPDVKTHLFRLYIFAREVDVKVTLPSLFRGVVHIRNQDGFCQSGQARYCGAFRDRMRRGLIRLDSCVLEDDDEVYIHTRGNIHLRLMPLPGKSSGENMGMRVARHVRRIMRTMSLRVS